MRCLFCERPLPAGSSSCGACGNPSHFRPCGACDAVNPRDASSCWRCHTALALLPEAEPVFAMPEAATKPVFGREPAPTAWPVPAARVQHAVTLVPRPPGNVGWRRLAIPAVLVALLAGAGLSALQQDEIPDAGSTVPMALTVPAELVAAPAASSPALPSGPGPAAASPSASSGAVPEPALVAGDPAVAPGQAVAPERARTPEAVPPVRATTKPSTRTPAKSSTRAAATSSTRATAKRSTRTAAKPAASGKATAPKRVSDARSRGGKPAPGGTPQTAPSPMLAVPGIPLEPMEVPAMESPQGAVLAVPRPRAEPQIAVDAIP